MTRDPRHAAMPLLIKLRALWALCLLVCCGGLGAARAATLPGLPLVFDTDPSGTWTLAAAQAPGVIEAGLEPGWVLIAVDGVATTDVVDMQHRVAAGPARNIQLSFRTPQPEHDESSDLAAPVEPAPVEPAPVEVIVVVPRAPLVWVQQLGILPWPEGFVAPVASWSQTWAGVPTLTDHASVDWQLDTARGAFEAVEGAELSSALVPDAFWFLSDAAWVVDRADAVVGGDAAWASEVLAAALRLRSFQGRSADHLLLPTPDGLEVLVVQWPLGTPVLSTCTAAVPETCLASGEQILDELGDRPGARAEAARQLGLACSGGVHRGCYEAVALDDERLSQGVQRCIGGDVGACNVVANARLRLDPEHPSELVLGLLDYACELEGAGSLGERLRRLEDVGAGCMTLSRAHDSLGRVDQALLNLDQACMLGRADACEEAADRRHQAFAARTTRECEDDKLPIAASCVEEGRLLQEGPIDTAGLDAFDAFLRGCTLGATEGCVLLGDYVDRWGIGNSRVLGAETQLRRACNDGEQRAWVVSFLRGRPPIAA